MTRPTIVHEGALPVIQALSIHAPAQGGIEYQNDLPGKLHDWHSHSVHERLVVLSGSMVVAWLSPGGTQSEREVTAGDRIELPAGTVHRSTAGPQGCTYLICPDGGKPAITVPSAPPSQASASE
jgi:uncharacterized protein YjlB